MITCCIFVVPSCRSAGISSPAEEFLKPLGFSQTEFAERIGVLYPCLYELIHGEHGVTLNTALARGATDRWTISVAKDAASADSEQAPPLHVDE